MISKVDGRTGDNGYGIDRTEDPEHCLIEQCGKCNQKHTSSSGSVIDSSILAIMSLSTRVR